MFDDPEEFQESFEIWVFAALILLSPTVLGFHLLCSLLLPCHEWPFSITLLDDLKLRLKILRFLSIASSGLCLAMSDHVL